MAVPLLVGPALWGATAISGGLKAGGAALGLGGAYAALRGMGVDPFGGGRPGSMYDRRGLTPPGGRTAPGRYPHPAGPAFGGDQQNFPNGRGRVGGGNAGASTADQWPRLSAGSSPGGRTVPITQPVAAGRARALNVAAQNAGLPASRYQDYQRTPEFAAAAAASQEALAARAAQGGRGYLSAAPIGPAPTAWSPEAGAFSVDGAGFAPEAFTGGEGLSIPGLEAAGGQRWMAAPGTFNQVDTSGPNPFSAEALAAAANLSIPGPQAANALPDVVNPATQAYWDRADIRAWAGANDKLAARLRERHGLPPLRQEGGVDLSTAVRPQPGAPAPAAQLEAFNAEAPIAPAAELATGAQPSWLPSNPMAPPAEEKMLTETLRDRFLNLARMQLIGANQ